MKMKNIKKLNLFILVLCLNLNNFVFSFDNGACYSPINQISFNIENDIYLGEKLLEDDYSVTGIVAVLFNSTFYNLLQTKKFESSNIMKIKAIKACENSGFDNFYYQITACFHPKST